MADEPATPPVETGGEVAALAAASVETAAQTAAALEIHEAETEAALEEVVTETEKEFAWLRTQLTEVQMATSLLASNLENLPGAIAQAMRDAVREVLKELTPQPSEAELQTPATEQAPSEEEAARKAAAENPQPRKRVTNYL